MVLRRYPKNRWDINQYYDPEDPTKAYTQRVDLLMILIYLMQNFLILVLAKL